MKTTLSALLILALTVPLLAQSTVEVPYTAAQLLAIKWAVGQAQDPVVDEGSVTNGQAAAYGIARCQDIWDSYVDQRATAKLLQANVQQQYLALSDADKAAVDAYVATCTASGCP